MALNSQTTVGYVLYKKWPYFFHFLKFQKNAGAGARKTRSQSRTAPRLFQKGLGEGRDTVVWLFIAMSQFCYLPFLWMCLRFYIVKSGFWIPRSEN